MFCLIGGIGSWKSLKKEADAYSTTEVNYINLNAGKEVVLIIKFIIELGIVSISVYHINLYYDNNDAITQSKEPISH